MTLQTLYFFSRKVALWSILVTSVILSPHTGLLAQKKEKQDIDRQERNYGPMIHEMRQRMITDPATSGDIKDYAQVRKFGFEAWRSLGNQHAFKSLAAQAWNQVTLTGSQSGHTSGRARSIAFHPTDPNTVWVATAQGGIWRTNEIYAESPKWVNLSENLPTLAMGAIAVDPKDPNILFAGTGETNGGYSTPSGQGLFRSMNGGLDWKLVLAPDSGAAAKAGAGYNCSQIVIDPKDSKRIYVATANQHGLVRSTDGGDSWKKVTTESISPVSIALNPQETNRLYISGMNGKVLRSEDGGDTWATCKLGTLTTSNRIQLALWDANPNIVYAAVLKSSGTTQIYRTEDHGANWTLQCDANAMVGPYPDRSSKKVNYLWDNTQGSYAHSLAVDPVNGNILAGGLFIVFSSASDKGQNLNTRTQNNIPNVSDYVHADCQYLAFNNDGKLFALSDGGISYGSANGTNWTGKANQNMGSLQFVGVDADRSFTFVLGGTQDNGTNKAAVDGEPHWKEVRGGDGGMTRVSQEDPSIVYGTSVNSDRVAVVIRSDDFGNSWSENILCNPDLVKPGALEFYPKYDVSANANVVALAASSTVYVDAEGGLGCFPIKGKVIGATSMGGRPSAIHIAPLNEYMMWAAVSRNIYTSLDQGENWSKIAVNTFSGYISDITSDLANPQLVFAVSAGASTTPGKNFARSIDGGKTWEFPATSLPSIPTWSVAKAKNGHLFIGTDFGVLYSLDNGATWSKLGEGLPMSQVLSLEVRGDKEQWLLASTFGRGAYYIDITNPAGGVGTSWKHSISVGKSYPNPVTAGMQEVKVDFTLENAGLAQVVLHDIQGREVMTLAKDQYDAGTHSFTIPVADLDAGTYFYSLTSDGQTLSDKLVVTK